MVNLEILPFTILDFYGLIGQIYEFASLFAFIVMEMRSFSKNH